MNIIVVPAIPLARPRAPIDPQLLELIVPISPPLSVIMTVIIINMVICAISLFIADSRDGFDSGFTSATSIMIPLLIIFNVVLLPIFTVLVN